MSLPAPNFQFLYQQDQTQIICRAPEHDPEEYNAGNHYYGLGDLFCAYVGMQRDGPLPFGMDHAVHFAPEEHIDRDLPDGLPVFLATTKERAKACEAAGISQGVAIGSAFFYAISLYQRRHGRSSVNRRGTIVFPHKSNTERQRDFDDAEFADWLVSLPSEYQPVVVNLYFLDYLRGKDAVYRSRGLQVVSCGHFFDNRFLLRFYDLCRQFRYACGNALSTSFTFSVLSGCQFIYRRTSGHREQFMDSVTLFEDDPTLRGPLTRQALALSPFPPVAGGFRRQLQLARQLAGYRNVRWPWSLRRLCSAARKRLLALRGTGLNLSQPFARRQLYAWMPRGIDYDGWLQPEASLLVPSSRNGARLEFMLELPGWSNLPEAGMDVSVDNVPLATVKMVPGISSLHIPLPPAKGDQRVKVRMQCRFAMPGGDTRIRSARLIEFQLHEGTQGQGSEVTVTAMPQP